MTQQRIQIGHRLLESTGDELVVYLYQYEGEEPDEIRIEGHACDISFDPTTPAGRGQVRALMARLAEALDQYEKRAVELYAQFEVGDYCDTIRRPVDDEPRCKILLWGSGRRPHQCSRVQHCDHHHVAVDDEHFQVVAVTHPVARLDLVVPDARAWLVRDS